MSNKIVPSLCLTTFIMSGKPSKSLKRRRAPGVIAAAQIRRIAHANGVMRMNSDFQKELAAMGDADIAALVRVVEKIKGTDRKTVQIDMVAAAAAELAFNQNMNIEGR